MKKMFPYGYETAGCGSRFEDEYSTKWASAFDEAGRVLLQMTAEDLDNIKFSPELPNKLQPLQSEPDVFTFTGRLVLRCCTFEFFIFSPSS